MPTPGNPKLQGSKYGIEAVAYGTRAASLIGLQTRSSTLKKIRRNAKSGEYMGLQTPILDTMPAYVEGELVAGFSNSTVVLDALLGAMCAESTAVFTIGDGSMPDNTSLTVENNYGGVAASDTYATEFLGLIPVKFRIDMPANASAFMTIGFAGKDEAEVTSPSDPSPFTQSGLFMPSEYGALSFDSVECTFKGGFVEATIPHGFIGLDDIGADTVRRACWAGNWSVNWSFNVELDDATGSDTIAHLSNYIGDGAGEKGDVGTIALGSWLSLGTPWMTGDHPSQQIGPVDWVISGEAKELEITDV